jgi:hypothetical protein
MPQTNSPGRPQRPVRPGQQVLLDRAFSLKESYDPNMYMMVCPVCKDTYSHQYKIEEVDGQDDYRAGWGGRGDLTVISYFGECGHQWEICLGFHKGQTYAFVNIRDDIQIDFSSDITGLFENVGQGDETGVDLQPPIVCLVGSTQFWREYQQAEFDETIAGRIYLSVGFFVHSPDANPAQEHGEMVGITEALKLRLDQLHRRKIDRADEVLVVSDETGYFGRSTYGEITYALGLGKPVRWVHDTARQRYEDILAGRIVLR